MRLVAEYFVDDKDMNDDDCVAILIRMFLFDCQIELISYEF